MCCCTFLYPFVFETRANSHQALDYNLIISKKTVGNVSTKAKDRKLHWLRAGIEEQQKEASVIDKDQNSPQQNSSSTSYSALLDPKNPSHDFLRLTPGRPGVESPSCPCFWIFRNAGRRFGMKLKTQSELSKVGKTSGNNHHHWKNVHLCANLPINPAWRSSSACFKWIVSWVKLSNFYCLVLPNYHWWCSTSI